MPHSIDTEWAQSLVGLRLKIPDHWWPDYDGDTLNPGKIGRVDFTQTNNRYFVFIPNDAEDPGPYYLRYDTIFHYADHNQRNFSSYQLPRHPPPNPDGDEVQVRRQQRIQRSSNDDDDDDGTASTSSLTDSAASSDDDTNDDERDDDVVNAYVRTNPEDWTCLKNGAAGRVADPIPFTGESEEFSVDITDEEAKKLIDDNGDVGFERVLEYTLPRFGEADDTILWEWQAARMHNYMTYIILQFGWKPKYYNPEKGIIITADHVCRFYGAMLGRMLSGNPSIDDMWSTRCAFKAVGPVKESMPQDAMKDLCRCMHFADDWEEDDERWNELYDADKEAAPEDMARHRRKFGVLEDAYNKQWQSIMTFGRWVTADESRVAGWYHSPMTIGPEPKPIRTGATLHTLCVTKGPLRTYKPFARAYGGKTDGDLDGVNEHTVTTQKWVNLYDIMLDPFKDMGCCCTMDSAYMGDIMAQIGRHEWKINMVGTSQENRTGADTKEEKAAMKKGTYDAIMWQHNEEELCYAIWSDNNFVRTLSNFHSPELIEEGLNRRRRVDGSREGDPTPVTCPHQNKNYSETFHLIDKGNGAEAKYDLGFESHTHGSSPKLSFRYFNMCLNNAYKIYEWLVTKYTPNRRFLDMDEAITLAAHAFLQRGESMRQQKAEHPSNVRNLNNVHHTGWGRKIRSDAQGQMAGHGPVRNASLPTTRLVSLKNKQKTNSWCTHQSIAIIKRGKCAFGGCPGLREKRKRKRGFDTYHICEECTANKEGAASVYFAMMW